MKDTTVTKTFMGGDKLIGSLALIRTCYLPDDFISTYIPFVATLLVEKNYDVINIETLVTDFKHCFGFIIPRSPMVTIIKKCGTKEIVNRCNNGTYTINKENAKKMCFTEQAKAETQKYINILGEFVKYVANDHTIQLSLDDAERIFIAFLEENSAKTLTLDFGRLDSNELTNKQNFFLVSCFITYISNYDYTSFKLVKDIAVSHLIASAITFDENEDATVESVFRNLTLYLDTPFILRVLGLNTDEMKTSYLDLMEELESCNSIFKLFGHTYSEILTILQDCERWIDDSNYQDSHASLALRNFVKKKCTKSDIQLYISTLEDKLKDLHIEIDDVNYYSESYNHLQIDDTPIREGLIKSYMESNPNFNVKSKEATIEYDVKSISNIFKLRENKIFRSFKDAKYLFLTTNSTLAYVTRNFTSQQIPNFKSKIYPCMTDIALGTNIWLNSPINRIETFSTKKLLADCMACMTLSDELISKLTKSIEDLSQKGNITQNEYYLLKSYGFNNYLQKQTLNDESAFSDKITEELLEEIKLELLSPLTYKLDKLDTEMKNVLAENASLSDEIAQNELRKKETETLKEMTYDKYKEKSLNSVNAIIHFLIPVGFGSIVLCLLFISKLIPMPNYISIGLTIISGLLGFISLIATSSLKINLFKLQDKLIERKIEKYHVNDYKANHLKNIHIKNRDTESF